MFTWKRWQYDDFHMYTSVMFTWKRWQYDDFYMYMSALLTWNVDNMMILICAWTSCSHENEECETSRNFCAIYMDSINK